MKFSIITHICFAGALLLAACEEESKDHLVEPQVYIINYGIQTATYYDIETDLDYNVYVYNSGFSAQTADVKISPSPEVLEAYNHKYGKSYKLLGEEYYAFIQKDGTLDNRRSTLTVRMNCTAIKSLPDAQNYIIPLQLTAVGIQANDQICSILINPQIQETKMLVENPGIQESNLSGADNNTLMFNAYTEFNNKWDATLEYEYGDEVLAEYNAAHGTNYMPLPAEAYTFHPANLVAGENKAVSTVEIDKSKLIRNCYYTLAAKLTRCSKFKVSDNNLVLYHICLLPALTTDTRKQWTLISCSSYMNSDNIGNATDGNDKTFWQGRWKDADGGGDLNKLPVSAVWDMGKSYYWGGVSIARRSDSYVTDLKGGYIELSDDQTVWTIAQYFDFGGANNTTVRQKFSLEGEPWPSGRYVRLVCTESNRNPSIGVAEFEPSLIEMAEN